MKITVVLVLVQALSNGHTWGEGVKVQLHEFLGAFAKLRKETINFVMSVCPSVLPHGTTRLQLDGFSGNLIFEYFSKINR